VVPKHRRSVIQPSLPSVGAPVNTAECPPEAFGYGWSPAVGGPTAVHARSVAEDDGYRARADYVSATAEPDWTAALEGRSWQDPEDWQYLGPPPALHPDHPSAPLPRAQFPPDQPLRPLPVPRVPGPPAPPSSESRPSPGSDGLPGQPPVAGGADGPGSLPTYVAVAAAGQVRRNVSRFRRQPGSAARVAVGSRGTPELTYYETTDAGRRETTDYHREGGHFGPGSRHATGQHQDGRSRHGDSLWMVGQVLTRADHQAAQIAQQAQHDAAAIRDAAEREAAAIREAAEQDAAEMRARLESMLSELARTAAYVTESLATAAMPATAPVLPGATPALPRTRSAPPATRPPKPDTTRNDRSATRLAEPSVRPAAKSAGRQAKALRKMMAAFAFVSVVGAVAGTAELALHGFPFFIFRANGAGASETGPREPANPPRAGQPFLPGARHELAAHHKQAADHKPASHHKQTKSKKVTK
jgi:hypothetical protein